MTKPMNIEAIEKGSGKTWAQWLEFFDRINAKDLPHNEIAKLAYNEAASGWWAQNVTVAYEQHIGRRVPGQREDGSFEVTVTKAIAGTLDDAMGYWQHKVADVQEFNAVDFANEPTQSTTDKWRHWRVNLGDGSKVIVSTNQTTPSKAQLAVTSQKLPSPEAVEHWRAYWKQFLS